MTGAPEHRGPPPPSLAMVAAGGVGVLVVIAFVAAVALGGRATAAGPGERLGIGRADAEGALAVFVPRCRDDRVKVVEVTGAGGDVLWRITSRKGSIDERYEVGADAPLGFDVEVPLGSPLPDVPLVAAVGVDGEAGEVRDQLDFSPGAVPEEGVVTAGGDAGVASFQGRAIAAARCPESRSDVGLTTVVFTLGALLVVASYLVLVSRWWRGRR